jgi:hypothetical protein
MVHGSGGSASYITKREIVTYSTIFTISIVGSGRGSTKPTQILIS